MKKNYLKKYHNPNWIRDFYFRPNIIAYVEYGIFVIAIIVLLCYKTNTMKIASIKPFNYGQYCNDQSCTGIGPNNLKILLTGTVLVTGEYFFMDSPIGFSGYCMKNFDNKFLGGLPYDISNEKVRVFCFRNDDFARNKLGTSTRKVNVVIDNLELNFYPSEVMNWADLVEGEN